MSAELLQYILTGLTVGCVYALVGLAFTVIYNATGVINFAQGEFVVLGALLFYTLLSLVHLPLAVALVLAVVAAVLLTALAYLQWVERKVIAHIQLRLGPSRVGPHGLLQPVADVIKLATKEGLVPPNANKFLYVFAPFLAVTLALLIGFIAMGQAVWGRIALAVIWLGHLLLFLFGVRTLREPED